MCHGCDEIEREASDKGTGVRLDEGLPAKSKDNDRIDGTGKVNDAIGELQLPQRCYHLNAAST